MNKKKSYRRAEFKDAVGSGFEGYLEASFEDLVAEFGEPHWRSKEGVWFSEDQKVRAEWAFKIGSGKQRFIFTIYDYKDPRPVEEVDLWHIGSKGDSNRLMEIFSINKVSLLKRNRDRCLPEQSLDSQERLRHCL